MNASSLLVTSNEDNTVRAEETSSLNDFTNNNFEDIVSEESSSINVNDSVHNIITQHDNVKEKSSIVDFSQCETEPINLDSSFNSQTTRDVNEVTIEKIEFLLPFEDESNFDINIVPSRRIIPSVCIYNTG